MLEGAKKTNKKTIIIIIIIKIIIIIILIIIIIILFRLKHFIVICCLFPMMLLRPMAWAGKISLKKIKSPMLVIHFDLPNKSAELPTGRRLKGFDGVLRRLNSI